MAEVLMGTMIFSMVVITAMFVFRHSFLLAKNMEERVLILSDSAFPRYLIGNFLQFAPEKPYFSHNVAYFDDYSMRFGGSHIYRMLSNDQSQPILVYDSPLYHNRILADLGEGLTPITKTDDLYRLKYDVKIYSYKGPMSFGYGRYSNERTVYKVDMKFLPLYKYYGLPDRIQRR